MPHKQDDSSGHKLRPASCCRPSHDSSIDCHKCRDVPKPVKWEENCPPGPCPDLPAGRPGKVLYDLYKSAVVRIYAETTVTTSTNPADRVGQALAYQTNVATVYMYSNGFLVDNGIIVAPAQVALLPPNTKEVVNRYPFTVNEINPLADGNAMIRAGRFVADVFDVNGSGHSFSYQLRLLGVDGKGDYALFQVDSRAPWNNALPCIKPCHPHFRFGCSRKYRAGLEVYSIGDPFARTVGYLSAPPAPSTPINNSLNPFANPSSAMTYIEGKVTGTRQIDYMGYAQQELVTVDFEVGAFKAGMPILDRYGHVIAMQTLSKAAGYPYISAVAGVIVGDSIQPVGEGVVAGPSSFYMQHGLKQLARALAACPTCFVTTVNDPFGAYYRVISGYLGLSWTNVTGKNYMSFYDAAGYQQPRFAADGVTLLTSPLQKEIIGIAVRGLAGGAAPQPMVVPGATTAGTIPGSFVDSPLLGVVAPNDIITHAACCPLGGLGYQIPISLVISRLKEGDVLNLGVRFLSQGFDGATPDQPATPVKVTLARSPAYTEYPWYRYGYAATLLSNLTPMLPQPNIFNSSYPIIGGLVFAPSI